MPPILSESLNPQQEKAVLHDGGPLLVLAGAGTGKTRVIVHRIARLIDTGVLPGRILAVTFTNKAAEEMRRRIETLSPGGGAQAWVHTYHAFAVRILRRHAKEIGLQSFFMIYDQDDQKRLVTETLKELGLEDKKNRAGLFVSIISRAKDDLLDAGSYAIHAEAEGNLSRIEAARVYARYQAKLEKAGGLDFGDLLLKLAELLRDNGSIRQYYQEYFLHVLVDEYQDTNHAQYFLTKTLAASHRNLCVVGDDDQGIYTFRGANIRNILDFEHDFPDAQVVALEQNYRSTPEVLAAATTVIAHNRFRKEKTLWTHRTAGDPVEVRELSTEMEEARWVVRRAQAQVEEGRSLGEIAVFYRTNAQSRAFEEELLRHSIPYRVVGAMRFYERKEVRDALAYARVALNPHDSISLGRILNVPARGIGKAGEERLKAFAAEQDTSLYDALGKEAAVPDLTPICRRGVQSLLSILKKARSAAELPPGEAMSKILEASGYWDWLETESEEDPEAAQRLGNLQELLNAIQDFEKTDPDYPARTLSAYLEAVSLQTPADTYDRERSAVTLMTVHLAKGLEFSVVFVTGLEEGLFPINAASSSPEDLEEERRLCYVAMTRAREKLYLTYASQRRLFGKAYANLPSRFILEAGLLDRVQAEGTAEYPSPAGALRVGCRVQHPYFGVGRVIEKTGSGESLKVTVAFQGGRTRRLLVRYAPLQVVA